MKFAFLIMGNFDSKTDRAVIHDVKAIIIVFENIEYAAQTADELFDNVIDCIELCGAFGEEGARKIIAATNNEIPVGYVTHLPEQDDIYKKAFAR